MKGEGVICFSLGSGGFSSVFWLGLFGFDCSVLLIYMSKQYTKYIWIPQIYFWEVVEGGLMEFSKEKIFFGGRGMVGEMGGDGEGAGLGDPTGWRPKGSLGMFVELLFSEGEEHRQKICNVRRKSVGPRGITKRLRNRNCNHNSVAVS